MRLLDKKTANTEIANQKATQIKEGLILAKKVDALRETLQAEEGNLETFRVQSIQRVQQEIDAKILERQTLETGNVKLREERILAQAPIDLKEEWLAVRENKQDNERRQLRLDEFEVNLIAREGDNRTLEEMLLRQKKDLREKDKLSERTLREAEQKFAESSDLLAKTTETSETILTRAHSKETSVLSLEADLSRKEEILISREEAVNRIEIDLANREKALTDKYNTFLRAQQYIKSKKKK